ncbi:MAG TPA: hypothetical protein VNP37_10775 [Actinomycetospora sp.]|nr:hypothetical protein [Actinomycetospora sp.]
MSEGGERWLCLGGRQHGWVVTGWDNRNESMSAYELFCPTCGRLVGREGTDTAWSWVPLEDE